MGLFLAQEYSTSYSNPAVTLAFRRWARTCGTAEEPMPEIPMNEQLLEEQA